MTEPRTSRQIARDACKDAQARGLIRGFDIRDGGRATIFLIDGKNKIYTQHVLDTLAELRRIERELVA